jgi:hypothetical protein
MFDTGDTVPACKGSRRFGAIAKPELNSQSSDVTFIQKRKPRKLEPGEYSLLIMIPVGVQLNNIVVKSFSAEVSGEEVGRGA